MKTSLLAFLLASTFIAGCAGSSHDESATSGAAATASSSYRAINATTDPLYDRFSGLQEVAVDSPIDGLTLNVSVVHAQIYLGVTYAGKSALYDVGPWSEAFASDKITMPTPNTIAITEDMVVTVAYDASGPSEQATVSVDGTARTVEVEIADDLAILAGIRGSSGTTVFADNTVVTAYETASDIVLQIGDSQTFPLGIPGESLRSLANVDPQHWTLELTTDRGKYRISPSDHVIGLTKE